MTPGKSHGGASYIKNNERRYSMKKIAQKMMLMISNKKGMEMVQVAILVAIAVAVGIIFKSSIVDFVNRIFGNLDAANF